LNDFVLTFPKSCLLPNLMLSTLVSFNSLIAVILFDAKAKLENEEIRQVVWIIVGWLALPAMARLIAQGSLL
jgi:uncharacterized membrane protein